MAAKAKGAQIIHAMAACRIIFENRLRVVKRSVRSKVTMWDGSRVDGDPKRCSPNMIKGTKSKIWMGYTSQLPICVTRRFMRNMIATIVQMAVVVPTKGKVPMMMPHVMLSASIWGVSPCFNREIMGELTYFLKIPWVISISDDV
jgi:hypothetical protein